jgi:hypothetical protein
MACLSDTSSRLRRLLGPQDAAREQPNRDADDGLLQRLTRAEMAAESYRQRVGRSRHLEQPELARGDEIAVFQALEAIHQQRLVFRQRLRQDGQLFALKLVMAWTSYFALLAANIYVMAHHREFGNGLGGASIAALAGQTIVLFVWLWRGISKRGSAELSAITDIPVLVDRMEST